MIKCVIKVVYNKVRALEKEENIAGCLTLEGSVRSHPGCIAWRTPVEFREDCTVEAIDRRIDDRNQLGKTFFDRQSCLAIAGRRVSGRIGRGRRSRSGSSVLRCRRTALVVTFGFALRVGLGMVGPVLIFAVELRVETSRREGKRRGGHLDAILAKVRDKVLAEGDDLTAQRVGSKVPLPAGKLTVHDLFSAHQYLLSAGGC
mmetsp:Transcript_7948/g.20007  ORF Transcript_7948/g.20007 Transcript_7948/m.20007 type:complete len:202 (-) Transcript_7948:106-711(-)